MKVTTIEEALAKCPTGRCYFGMTYIPKTAKVDNCPSCNGTGYACGIAPTEVERHLFAIVQATRALAGHSVPPGIVELLANCLAAITSTPAREPSLERAEALALSGRGGDDE